LTGKEGNKARQAADYLVSVFESSPFALIALDMRLRIMMFSRAARKLTGFNSIEVVGHRVNRIIQFRRVKKIIDMLRSRGRASIDGYITKLTGSGGREIPVRLRISPLTGPGNNLMGVLLIASDLAELRRLQGKLLEAERIAAITETAIGINHEINNPLCSILGNTQLILMEKDRLDPRMIKKLHSIEREIDRIREISERLAKITRPALKEYVGGSVMLDLERSEIDDEEAETVR
jgi:PAS domain S-box-containing protein